MVVEMIMIYCLSADPSQCVERRPAPSEDMQPTMMSCMIEAQPTAAAFLRDHPGYVLKTVRCRVGNRAPDQAI